MSTDLTQIITGYKPMGIGVWVGKGRALDESDESRPHACP